MGGRRGGGGGGGGAAVVVVGAAVVVVVGGLVVVVGGLVVVVGRFFTVVVVVGLRVVGVGRGRCGGFVASGERVPPEPPAVVVGPRCTLVDVVGAGADVVAGASASTPRTAVSSSNSVGSGSRTSGSFTMRGNGFAVVAVVAVEAALNVSPSREPLHAASMPVTPSAIAHVGAQARRLLLPLTPTILAARALSDNSFPAVERSACNRASCRSCQGPPLRIAPTG